MNFALLSLYCSSLCCNVIYFCASLVIISLFIIYNSFSSTIIFNKNVSGHAKKDYIQSTWEHSWEPFFWRHTLFIVETSKTFKHILEWSWSWSWAWQYIRNGKSCKHTSIVCIQFLRKLWTFLDKQGSSFVVFVYQCPQVCITIRN